MQAAWTSVDGAALTPRAYAELAGSTLFWRVLENTFEISLGSTLVCLLLGYPVAYHLAQLPSRRRFLTMILVLLPFWTSILVKSFAFVVMLGENGILNTVLRAVFGPEAAVSLIFNRTGVLIGMVHYLLPFMVFPDPGQPAGAGQQPASGGPSRWAPDGCASSCASPCRSACPACWPVRS